MLGPGALHGCAGGRRERKAPVELAAGDVPAALGRDALPGAHDDDNSNDNDDDNDSNNDNNKIIYIYIYIKRERERGRY